MNITSIGPNVEAVTDPTPWWLRYTLGCRECGSRFTIGPSDRRIGWFTRLLRLGHPRPGEYHVGRILEPDRAIDDDYVIAACPACTSRTITYRKGGPG